MGWTDADSRAAGAVGAPVDVTAEPGVRAVTLRWGEAENAEKIRVERRMAGEADWTVVAEGVAPAAGSFVDTGLANRQTYEYRVSGVGLQDRMIVPAGIVSATTLPPGMMFIFR